MGIGIAFEVRCGSVTMPGEGISIVVSQVTHRPFAKVKIAVDTTLVCLAVAGCYIFFGSWQWNVIGIGTIFAMIYVGLYRRIWGGSTVYWLIFPDSGVICSGWRGSYIVSAIARKDERLFDMPEIIGI